MQYYQVNQLHPHTILSQCGGQVALVERDYDGAGVLRGVRHSTAVKGGWSGGSM